MPDYVIADRRRQSLLTFTVAVSVFIFNFDYSILNISLPNVAAYFHISIGMVSWIPLVYLLIVTGTLLGFGKLGDVKGLRAVFVAGLAAFLAGTILSAVSPNFKILLGARAIQSLGEAMFGPVGIAILTTFLPSGIRGRAIGFAMLAQGLGLMLGSAAGGYVNAQFGWRMIFLINVPVVLFTILFAIRYIPKEQPDCDDKEFDIPGAAFLFVGLSSLVYALNAPGNRPFTDPVILGCIAVSLIALSLFILREMRCRYPLVDLALFKSVDFALANLSILCMISMLIGTSFAAPFMLELVMRLGVVATGLFLMAPPMMMIIFAPVAGRLADRIGSRPLCVAGAALATGAFALLSFAGKDSNLLYIMLSLLLLGSGAGIFIAPNAKLIMGLGPEGKQGLVSGVYRTCMNIGNVLGISGFTIIIMNYLRAEAKAKGIALAAIKGSPDLISAAFRAAFVCATFVCAFACVSSWMARDKNVAQ